MTEKYYFIVNPKSGSHLDITGIRRLYDSIRNRGVDVHLKLTKSLEHAGTLAKNACLSGATLIIVAGGDGTVRTVIDAIVGTNIPILIIPAGTENLLAGVVGLDGSIATTENAINNGHIIDMDLGQANGQHFMAITGVGFDAEVIQKIYSQRTGHITHASYIWPICQTFWGYKFPHFSVIADGELICDEPALVFVSNISRYAIGLGISPEAELGDGLLNICIYKCSNHLQLLSHSIATSFGRSDMSPKVIRQTCKKVTIHSQTPGSHVQMDGDPGPELPLEIEILPKAARLLVPPESSPVRFYHFKRWFLR